MALVRWEPAREVSSLQTEMNRLFNSFFEPAAGAAPAGAPRWVPAMDLVETDEAFVLRADLPGVDESDVHVEVDGDVLTVSGERRTEQREKQDGYVRVERAHGTFRRSVSLPDGIDPEQVHATSDRGVLTIRIPKPEQRKPHKVQINITDTPQTIEAQRSTPEPTTA
jgi:HSP20 family protein